MPSIEVENTTGKEFADASNIKPMFIAPECEYKLVILDPSKVKGILNANIFFENPQVPEDSVLKYENFSSGHEAFLSSKSFLETTVNSIINNKKENNIHSNVIELVISKSPSGKAMVQGFIEAGINNSSITYLSANNPRPKELQVLREDMEMSD